MRFFWKKEGKEDLKKSIRKKEERRKKQKKRENMNKLEKRKS